MKNIWNEHMGRNMVINMNNQIYMAWSSHMEHNMAYNMEHTPGTIRGIIRGITLGTIWGII